MATYLLTIELDNMLISLFHKLCDIQEQLYYTYAWIISFGF